MISKLLVASLLVFLAASSIVIAADNSDKYVDTFANHRIREFFDEKSELVETAAKGVVQEANGKKKEILELKFKYKSGLTVTVEYESQGSKLVLVEYILPENSEGKVSGIWKEECPQDLLSRNPSVEAEVAKKVSTTVQNQVAVQKQSKQVSSKSTITNSTIKVSSENQKPQKVKDQILAQLLVDQAIDSTYQFVSYEPTSKGYIAIFKKGTWTVTFILDTKYKVLDKQLTLTKKETVPEIPVQEQKKETVGKKEESVSTEKEGKPEIKQAEKVVTTKQPVKVVSVEQKIKVQNKNDVKDEGKPIQKATSPITVALPTEKENKVSDEVKKEIIEILDKFVTPGSPDQTGPVYELNILRKLEQSQYQIILNIIKLNLQYRIVLKRSTQNNKFTIVDSGYFSEKLQSVLSSRKYVKYTGPMNSPLIAELDRLIKLSLPKDMDNSGKQVEEVLLSEPFMRVSYMNEKGVGFIVDLVFDRFVNRISLLEILKVGEKTVEEKKKDIIAVGQDGTTVETVTKQTLKKEQDQAYQHENKENIIKQEKSIITKASQQETTVIVEESGKKTQKQGKQQIIVLTRDQEGKENEDKKNNEAYSQTKEYAGPIEAKDDNVIYQKYDDTPEERINKETKDSVGFEFTDEDLEAIPENLYANLDPNDPIMGAIAEEMLTQLILSMGQFDPTFKLKTAVFTLIRTVLVVRFETSIKGKSSFSFYTLELSNEQFESILEKYQQQLGHEVEGVKSQVNNAEEIEIKQRQKEQRERIERDRVAEEQKRQNQQKQKQQFSV